MVLELHSVFGKIIKEAVPNTHISSPLTFIDGSMIEYRVNSEFYSLGPRKILICDFPQHQILILVADFSYLLIWTLSVQKTTNVQMS